MTDPTLFEVWSEGYAISGARSGAILHGTAEGRSFPEACLQLARDHRSFAHHFDPDRMTYWGCKLFDNEADARRSFG